MNRTIAIRRTPAGTIVTVTLKENGVTVAYPLKTTATSIGASIRAATNNAEDMLRQAREEIDRDE